MCKSMFRVGSHGLIVIELYYRAREGMCIVCNCYIGVNICLQCRYSLFKAFHSCSLRHQPSTQQTYFISTDMSK